MNTILIPTDFSDNARNALDYAIQCFDERFFKFILLHTRPLLSTDPQKSEEYITKKLQAELEKVKDRYPGREIHFEVMQGDLDDVIGDLSIKYNIALVVMGTRGLKEDDKAFWGTNTSNTIEKTVCPVIVVPEKATYVQPKQIIFATDFEVENERELDFLLDIAEKFSSRITALHILPEEGNIGSQALKGLHQLHSRGNQVASHFVRNDDVVDGITNFVADHRTDMLAVMTHSTSFMERLLGQSVTKALALHTDVPLLVLHDMN